MYRSWKPEIFDEGIWLHNGMAFNTEDEAMLEARDILVRYNYEGALCRAVESDQKPNYKFVDGRAVKITYKMVEQTIIRASLTLLWHTDNVEPYEGFYGTIDVDYPTDAFEDGIVKEYACFDLESFYACSDPDDYDDEDGAHRDYVKFFERKGNLPTGIPIVEEAGLPWRIIYNSSSHETIEVEGDEEVEE